MCDLVNLDFIANHFDKLKGIYKVLEVGSFNVNGNCKKFILDRGINYIGIDIREGPDVDLICDITDDIKNIEIKLDYEKFDLIICMNVLEHLFEPIKALNNMNHLLRQDGYMMIVTPLVWDLHDWPHDFYRLNPDFFIKYAHDNNLRILEGTFLLSIRDNRQFYEDINVLPMLIPHIYKCNVEKNDFIEITDDIEGLWTDLQKNQFIDERGLIQRRFTILKNPNELVVDSKYAMKKNEIFNILYKRYMGLILFNFAKSIPELRECWPHIYLNLIYQKRY